MIMMMICTGRALASGSYSKRMVQPTGMRRWRSASFQMDFPKAGYSRFGAVKPGRCQFFIMIGGGFHFHSWPDLGRGGVEGGYGPFFLFMGGIMISWWRFSLCPRVVNLVR